MAIRITDATGDEGSLVLKTDDGFYASKKGQKEVFVNELRRARRYKTERAAVSAAKQLNWHHGVELSTLSIVDLDDAS